MEPPISPPGHPLGDRHLAGRLAAVGPTGAAVDDARWFDLLATVGSRMAAAESFEDSLRLLAEALAAMDGIDGVAILEPAAAGPGLDALARDTGRAVSAPRPGPDAAAETVLPLLDDGEVVALVHVVARRPELLGTGGRRAIEGLGLHALAVRRLAESRTREQRLVLERDALVSLARSRREASLRDPVTGLPSREAWDDALPRMLAGARRDGVPISVAVLDLDHFHAVNEVEGRERADLLLREVAGAWSAAVREGDFVCRHGGASVAVALVGCELESAIRRVERLCAATPAGYSSSGGVACWDRAEEAVALTDRARTALVDAKVAGRARVAAAADAAGEGEVTTGWTRWAAILPEILSERRIYAVYQPVVGTLSGRIAAYEALARPAGGPPEMDVEGLFAAAQYRGLLRDLDWLCRRAALTGARALQPAIPLFVNVAASALLDPMLDVEHMLLLLRWAGRAPENLVLEITEREAVRDLDGFARVLASYRAHGFRFAIDDVGEGHSTLQVLATAVPEFIKVASSLVAAPPESGREAALRAVIAFGAATGGVVIAEGVGTERDLERVRRMGIALAQGRWVGPPVVLPPP